MGINFFPSLRNACWYAYALKPGEVFLEILQFCPQAQKWKQYKSWQINGFLKCGICIHTMDYLATKKEGNFAFVTWVDIDGSMLSEVIEKKSQIT